LPYPSQAQRIKPGGWILRVFLRLSLFAVISLVSRTYALEQELTRQSLAIQLCDQVLASGRVSPAELATNPLFKQVAPGVYQIKGSRNFESEIRSLALLIRRFGGKALAIGNFGHMKGVAAIDAVYFPRFGEPLNLSIKTAIHTTSTNGMNAFRKHAADAEASIKKNLSREGLGDSLGLMIDESGIHPRAGSQHHLYRIRTAEALFRILGLDVEHERLTGILMDVSVENHQTPILVTAKDADLERHREAGDTLLRILDDRVDEDLVEFPAQMNLSRMIRRMKSESLVNRFIALFPKASLMVDKSGIQTYVHQEK
jgi:hypothetical protein